MDVLLQTPEQTRSRRGRAEVVNELLGGGQKNVHQPWPLAPLLRALVTTPATQAAPRVTAREGARKEFKQNNSLSQHTGSTQVRTGAC